MDVYVAKRCGIQLLEADESGYYLGRPRLSEFGFWIVQLPGWLLFVYLIVAQCTAAFSYSLGVRMGTQEPAERVTGVGVAMFQGFAGADLIFYTPLLGIGLSGHFLAAPWSDLILGAALGITVYWPIVCLWVVRVARESSGWNLPKERHYWIVLPVITIWGFVCLVVLWTSAA